MKKILSLFALLMTIVIGAKADPQTDLIDGITLPSLPSGTYTGGTEVIHKNSNKAVVVDEDGNAVMQASSPGYGSPVADNFTWTNAYDGNDATWSTSGTSWNAISNSVFVGSSAYNNSTNAHNVGFNRRCNLRTTRTFAYRFTNCGGVAAAVKSQGNTDDAAAVMAVYEVSGTTQTLVKSVSSKAKALDAITVSDLDKTKTYVAYIYGANGSNGELYEVAFLAPTKTVTSQAYAGVKKGDATLVENTDFTKVDNVITLTSSYKTMTAPTDVKLINHRTYDDSSSDDVDVDVTFGTTASDGYFVGTATIALTTYTVKVPEYVPTSAPTITTDLEAAYNVIKGQTQELSIVAEDASSYQWYLDGVAVEGATSASYTFTAGSTIGATNEVYCEAINAAGTTNSATATITTVGRADCELTNIQFSNGAYGAINNAIYGDGTIAVPYIAGTSAPTVEEASINISDGATYVLDGNTLTVTAEDGTTSKEYTINAVEITPLTVSADVAETSFTEVPSWVFNLYGWDKDKGLKFAKAVNDAGNMRIAKGNTRQYYFIGAAKSLTLTKVGSTRKVNVYVNGTKVISDTDNDALGTIALDETAPNLVIVEAAAGTNGDGGFSAYAIEAAAATIEVTLGANGYSTYCGDANFTVTSGATAYTATLSGTTVTLNEIAANTVIGKGTGIVLVGTEGETAVLTPTTEAAASMELGNALVGVNAETTSIEANAYVLSSNGTKTSFVNAGTYGTVEALMNKAYIVYTGMQEGSLDIQFEGEATAINNVNANDNADSAAPVKVIKNGKLFIGNYNVAGQLVK